MSKEYNKIGSGRTLILVKWLFLLSVSFIFSCSVSKRTPPAPPTPKPYPEKIPQTKKDSIKGQESMDTIRWTVVDTLTTTPETPPSTTPDITKEGRDMKKVFKDAYQIGVILPFQASSELPTSGNRAAQWAVDYYWGLKMAFQDSKANTPQFRIHVFDSQASEQRTNSLIQQGKLDHLDVIIGPYRTNVASLLAEHVRDKETLLYSPYSANSKLGEGNPHYLQLNPSLETHLKAIFDYTYKIVLPNQPVLFLYGEGEVELSKKVIWESFVEKLAPSEKAKYAFLEIPSTDLSLSSTTIEQLLTGTSHHWVILPSWEEVFVQSVLRKLASERLEKTVTVFGLPQWISFERLESNHLEALNVHITSVDYYDPKDPDYKRLSQRYRETFGQLLNSDVVWGYRTGRFLISSLEKDGVMFQRFLEEKNRQLWSEGFRFEPTFTESYLYRLENKALQMLKFQGGAFTTVR